MATKFRVPKVKSIVDETTIRLTASTRAEYGRRRDASRPVECAFLIRPCP